jgi:3-methyladenine DNA glycosylase AlkC
VRATALADQTLNNLKKVGSPSDDPFLPCLKNSAITCSSGSCLAGKQESDAHEKLCKIRDENRPLEERLGLLRDLLKQSDHLAYVPTAAEVLKDLDIKSLSPSERATLDEIKSNQKLKSSLLDLVNTKSSTLITQRLNWIEFSSKLGWLSEAESVKEYQRIGRHLIQNFKDINNRDLFFSLLYDNPTISSAIEADKDAIASLTKALSDSDKFVREAAAEALQAIKPNNPAVISALAKSLGDPDYSVRWASVGALKDIKPDDPAVNSALAKALGDPEVQVRKAAAWALETIKPDDPVVNSALAKALGDADGHVSYAAAEALQAIKPDDPAVNSALVKALADSNKYVRGAAAEALQAIKPDDPKVKEQLKAAGIQVDW